MKKSIHPQSFQTKITDTKGNEFELVSCLKKNYQLAVDIHTHPAWTKTTRSVTNAGNVQKLVKKFKGFEEL